MISKQRIYEILDGAVRDRASKICEISIIAVVVVNVFAVILDSVPEIHSEYKNFFHYLELVSVIFFTTEYVLRVWSFGAKYDPKDGGASRGRKEYVFSFYGFIDFVATMPYYLQFFIPGMDLRVLRVLRMLRILKLTHYNSALQDLFGAVIAERRAFGSAMFLLAISTIVSASLMYFAEGDLQPEYFASIPQSMYWAVITITSGYGNIEPLTDIGWIISSLTGFLGVCMAAILTGIVASSFSNQSARKRASFEAQLKLALVDGEISDSEKTTLKRLQVKYRISEDELNEMVANFTNGKMTEL
ncbi:MAG: ion transporter [Burkholderiaceae bacterium]